MTNYRFIHRWKQTTDPPIVSLLFTIVAITVTIVTIFFEPSSPDKFEIPPLSLLSIERMTLGMIIGVIWILETFGYIRQRIIFIILATILPLVLLSLGRAIVGTLYLALVPAWAGYVGTPWQRYLALLFAELSILILAQVYSDTSFVDWITWLIAIPVVWFSFHMAASQRRLMVQLRAAQADLAKQAIAEERRHIAVEIHDVIAHSMAIMMLHLTGARNIFQRDPHRAEEALAKAEEIGRKSLADIRRSVYLLQSNPGLLTLDPPAPGLENVNTLVETYRTAGLKIQFSTKGDLALVSSATALGLFRIIQEALANVAKHAPRAHITVELYVGTDQTVLRVVDSGESGKNKASEKKQWRQGLGIQGMKDRVENLGGKIIIGPHNGGWQVDCLVPTENSETEFSAPKKAMDIS